MRRAEQLVLGSLACCLFCLIYPVVTSPVPQTTVHYAEPHSASSVSSVAAVQQQPAAAVQQPVEPMKTHGYFCKQGSCNICHYRQSEIRPLIFEPEANGDCRQSRVEGTNVTKAELAANGIKYLQVGGDWWNKCGDGWLNADFIFTRLPVGFVCEDWRTGRYILRQDAGHRWPFEDNSFDIVYSEHMFEHILPMDGSTFLKEMYRVLKPCAPRHVPHRHIHHAAARTCDSRAHTRTLAHLARMPASYTAADRLACVHTCITAAQGRRPPRDDARPREVSHGLRQPQAGPDRHLLGRPRRALPAHG